MGGGGGGGGGGGRALKVAFFCCVVVALLHREKTPGLTSFPGVEGISSKSKREPSPVEGACAVRDAGGAAAKVTMRKAEAAAVEVGEGGRSVMMTTGPGSYPPRCSAKCGRCRPCLAVHVAVPPGGTPVTAEYYPEAWRCKCGDRLYVP